MEPDDTNAIESHKDPAPEIWERSPDWFRRALAVPMDHGETIVDGVPVRFLTWGEPGRPGLIFVHGGGANAYWWAHIAAQFADDYRVLAMDISGHGDSGHRDSYSLVQWTDEVMAVAAAGRIEGPPVLIGHSMGGFVTIVTAALHSDDLAGVVVCDSPVTEPDPEVAGYHIGDAFGRARVYESLDVIASRFRTVPEQEHYLDYVLDHVARNSAKRADGGWVWKFDRNIFRQFSGSMRGVALPYLADVTCRLGLLRSENGLVTRDIGDSMFEMLGRVTPVIELPQAGHHAMLDEPLILLTAIRSLIADWQYSDPFRRRDA